MSCTSVEPISADAIFVALISLAAAEDSRRAFSAIRISEVSFLISCKSLLTASSRFPGGLPKYTSAQRFRFRSRAGLASGFRSGRGNVSGVMSQKYGKFTPPTYGSKHCILIHEFSNPEMWKKVAVG